MQRTIFTILALASVLFQVATSQASANTKKGWAGKLSSLDGGLGGTVVVTDANTLVVQGYELEDASAPALYWWGSTSPNLADGFRISNKQVEQAATSDTYTIALDAGKTAADFMTVGLWCEKFSVNFGQATLAPSDGQSQTGGSSPTTTAPVGGAQTQTSKPNSGVANTVGWVGASVVALFFTALLL